VLRKQPIIILKVEIARVTKKYIVMTLGNRVVGGKIVAHQVGRIALLFLAISTCLLLK